MSEWKKVRIGDVAQIYDGPHATPPPCEKSDAYFLGIPHITPSGHIDLTQPRYIAERDYAKWTKRVVPTVGDVVFSYEATLNLYARIPRDLKCCLGRRMGLVRPDGNKLNDSFLYYYFFSEEWRKTVRIKTINGATVDRLPIADFPDFEISLPPLATQRRITSILSNYDSAIANCRRQIALLEEAAMRLYKECFKDGKGEKKKIGEVCECVLGGTPNRAKPEYWGGNVAWINSGKVNELRIVEPSEYITELGLRKSAAKMMPRHTTVLAITGATLGQVSLLEIDSAANQSVVGVLENENLHYEFIYPLIVDNIRKLIMHQTGGAQQHICKDDVLNFEVHIPNKGELKKYGELARPMFEQISELFFTIRALAEARDRLLPKLMKGEIAV